MTVPTDQDLSRREEMSVSSAAMSSAPWGAATVTGGAVVAADLGLHVIHGSIHLSALSGSLSLGAAAFIAVAAAGALWRAKGTRAARWARNNPWRFALFPALAAAAIAVVLSVVTGGGIIGPIFSGLWHGAAVYGITGAVGAVNRTRKQR
jgi:hypothetical protein